MPTKAEFSEELRARLRRAELAGGTHIEINAGELHRKLGGYPGDAGAVHQMPSCCDAMYDEKRAGDTVIASPPKGRGPSLTIRYALPR